VEDLRADKKTRRLMPRSTQEGLSEHTAASVVEDDKVSTSEDMSDTIPAIR
jgi:hypothetical protein